MCLNVFSFTSIILEIIFWGSWNKNQLKFWLKELDLFLWFYNVIMDIWKYQLVYEIMLI